MTGTGGGEKDHRPVPDAGPRGVSGAEFAGAGLQFAGLLILAAFAGIWLDRTLKTSPWLLIVTVFLGAAVAFYTLYRKLMKGQRLGDRRQAADRREHPE
jgi:threonine/homoserine/homoserine lactone efflux protein